MLEWPGHCADATQFDPFLEWTVLSYQGFDSTPRCAAFWNDLSLHGLFSDQAISWNILPKNETLTRVSATARHQYQRGHDHTCARGIHGDKSRASTGRDRTSLGRHSARF
jgi:hypothetical protein